MFRASLIILILAVLLNLLVAITSASETRQVGGSRVMKNIQMLVRSKGKTCPKRLTRLCKREPDFTRVMEEAVALGVEHCHQQFKYTRWNCTLDKILFDDVSRESSVATAILSASLTHVFAKSCSNSKLKRCDKPPPAQNVTWTERHWKLGGRSDDVKFGRRMARRILIGQNTRSVKKNANFKDAVSIHNIEVGLKAADIIEENCECYGYSPSCYVQRCRKSLKDFEHPAKLLRSKYTEARMIHETEAPDRRRLLRSEKNRFYYIKQSQNFCGETRGRECRDEINCSVLCCARGFRISDVKKTKKKKRGKLRNKNTERKLYCK